MYTYSIKSWSKCISRYDICDQKVDGGCKRGRETVFSYTAFKEKYLISENDRLALLKH